MKFSHGIPERARVLVVEDTLINQKLNSFILSNWGVRHEICSNGREAIEKLENGETYDLILMDIRMPEIDGYDATRIIRSRMKNDVPIIGITAYPRDREKERCLSEGMNHYIAKPIKEEELYAMLVTSLSPAEVMR